VEVLVDALLVIGGMVAGSALTLALRWPAPSVAAVPALPMLSLPPRSSSPPKAAVPIDAPAPAPVAAPVALPDLPRAAVPAAVTPAAPETRRATTAADARPQTTTALDPLTRSGWIVLRDLPAAWGIGEHVVIGPAGLFLLDSRALDGEITVDGDHVTAVRADGERYRRDIGGRVRGNAITLFRDLRHRGGVIEPVNSIVVLWGDFPATRTDGARVTFIAGDALADHLRSRPVRLSPDQIASLAVALRRTAARLAA